MPAVYSFYVPKISCRLCVATIEKALKEMDGFAIERVASNVTQKKIGILFNEEVDESVVRNKITEALNAVGFTPIFSEKSEIEKQTRMHWIKGIIGTLFGVVLLTVSFVFSPLSMTIMVPLTVFSSILTIVLGAESYKRAFYEWRSSEVSMDTLFAVSTIVVLISSLVSFFIPWLPMMCESGLLIFGFRHLGQGIEGWLNNVMQFGVFFVDRLPKKIRVVKEGNQTYLRSLSHVKPSDIIEVASGEYVPLDGECLDESIFVYDTIISGATLPREVKKGELLLSGMEVAEGSTLRLRVTQPFKKSHLYRLDQRIFDAEFEEKAEYEITANKILRYFVPSVFIVAALSALFVGPIFSPALAVRCFIAVLVSACPCTLGLVVPLAVSIAKYKAAANGIEFKSGEKLQLASEVDCVVFDFNGTLTTGMPKVTREYRVDDEVDEQTFNCIIAQLEKNTRHPIGSALFNHVKLKTKEVASIPVIRKYFGVMGTIDGKSYLLGSKSMMLEHHVSRETIDSLHLKEPLGFGESAVYLSCEGRLLGYFVLATSLREGAKRAVHLLQAMNIDCYISSGSDPEMLEGFANELKIPLCNIRASQRGSLDGNGKDDDKSRFIKQLQQRGYKVVAMVGDAVNDVLAIGASNFGLAICHAYCDEKVTEKASAVVKSESLLPVVNTFVISKQMRKNIKQSLVLSFSYNILTECVAGGVLAAVGVVLNPSVGIALMILQMCLVLANAYRFKQQRLACLQEPALEAIQYPKAAEKASKPSIEPPHMYPSPILQLPQSKARLRHASGTQLVI